MKPSVCSIVLKKCVNHVKIWGNAGCCHKSIYILPNCVQTNCTIEQQSLHWSCSRLTLDIRVTSLLFWLMIRSGLMSGLRSGCFTPGPLYFVKQYPLTLFVVYWHTVGRWTGPMVLKGGRKRRFTYTNMNVQLAQRVNKKLENESHRGCVMPLWFYDIPLAHVCPSS